MTWSDMQMKLDVKEFYKLLVRPTVVISAISPNARSPLFDLKHYSDNTDVHTLSRISIY